MGQSLELADGVQTRHSPPALPLYHCGATDMGKEKGRVIQRRVYTDSLGLCMYLYCSSIKKPLLIKVARYLQE